MNKNPILKKYLDIHTEKAEKSGLTPEALWGGQRSQVIRFKILEKLFINNSGFSLLDLGCGLSDFYSFLEEKKFKDIDYTGVDINNTFIEESKNRYPDLNFYHGSIESIPKNINFDYVIASGLYNLGNSPIESSSFFVEQFIQLFKKVNVGIGVNFLSSWHKHQDNVSTYHNPAEMLTLCKDFISPHIVIYHHYLPNDFTVFVYKNQI